MADKKATEKPKTKKKEHLYDDPFPGSIMDEKTGKYKHETNRALD